MTRTDKQSAWAALVLMAMVACFAYYKHHSNLLYTLAVPAVMFLLWAWMGRAFSANWLVRHDANQFVFRKPLVFQALYGAMALGVVFITVPVWNDPIPTAAARYSITVFLLATSVFLLWIAEPSRTTFALSRHEYIWTRGFWPFVRTSRGSTTGGTVTLQSNRKGSYVMRFRPAHGGKWGILVAFVPREEADAKAYQLADALGVLVERKT